MLRLFTTLLLILSVVSLCRSQVIDSRWRLIDKDNAIVPVKDLVKMASHRLFLDSWKETYKSEAYARGKETLALKQALESKDAIIRMNEERMSRMMDELSYNNELLEDCNKEKWKLNRWANVGKVGTITVSLVVVGIATERILNSARR